MAERRNFSVDKREFDREDLEDRIPGIGRHLGSALTLFVHRDRILPSPEERARFMGGTVAVKEIIRRGGREWRPFLILEACRYVPNTASGIVEFADYLEMRTTRKTVLDIVHKDIIKKNSLYPETLRKVDIWAVNRLPNPHFFRFVPVNGFLTVSK